MYLDKDNQEIKSVPPTWQLVAEYDRKRKERQTFEKAYKRQTFFIRRDLIKKLNDLCNNRPGLKTQFVNSALEFCLADFEGKPVLGAAPTERYAGKLLWSGELTKIAVEQIAHEKVSQSGLDPAAQQSVTDYVMRRLFTDDSSEKTRLQKGEKFQSPDINQGKGKRYYSSAKLCVEDLVDHWIKNVKNNKLPPSLNQASTSEGSETASEDDNTSVASKTPNTQ